MRTTIALAFLCLQACPNCSTASASGKLPIKIYFLAGQSNMVGPAHEKYVQENHPELMNPRDDVFCAYAGKVTGPLKPGYGGREHSYGPELLMGKVLGDAIDHPILLVKSCTGGTTLQATAAVHLAQSTPEPFRRATWMCVEHLTTDPVEGGARNDHGWADAPEAEGIGATPGVAALGDPVARYEEQR